MKNVKNVDRFVFAPGAVMTVPSLIDERRRCSGDHDGSIVILIDHFFKGNHHRLPDFGLESTDSVDYIDSNHEPTTASVDDLISKLRAQGHRCPAAIVGIGGGTTMDSAKAVANLFTNHGPAASYQGWDLLKYKAAYKIAVPTLSGTGAESSRTCVMTNVQTGVKLGMNSDHTMFDQLVLDPNLSASVERSQYFFTGMDTYIHCVESLTGSYRNPVGDAFSHEAIRLCRKVFLSADMMSDDGRADLMVASYLGGCAIGMGFVGVVHPVSAALSVVLGTHHCLANCLTMTVMSEFYPAAVAEFEEMLRRQRIKLPTGFGASLSEEKLERMCDATLQHEKPLTNALGASFRDTLTRPKLKSLFMRM